MRPVVVLCCLVAALGCSNAIDRSPAFTISRASATSGEVDAIAARVAASTEPSYRDVFVQVAAAPEVGFSVVGLPGAEVLGHVGTALRGRPHLAGELVVARTADGITAWHLDGTTAWNVADDGFDLAGVAADGPNVALSLGGGGVTRRRGVLVVLGAHGEVRMRRAADHAFGAPALVGDDLFVPWDGQNLSVFSVSEDREIARLRSRDDVINFARREGNAVYFGGRALYRFEAASAGGRRDPAHTFVPTAEGLPGDPSFTLDGYTALRAGLDARERVRLVWRPDAAAASVTVTAGKLIALFHRELLAVSPDGQTLHWAYVHDRDLVAAEVTDQGVVVADENGQLTMLDPDGRPVWRVASNVAGTQGLLRVSRGFQARGGVDGGAHSRVASLTAAVTAGNDTRMVPAARYAIAALGRLEDPAATQALVNIVGAPNVAPEVMSAAAEALSRRTNGADAVLAALEARYDFVRGTAAPPVGVLARAAASIRDPRAVEPLLRHLYDPATAARDLAPIVSALRSIASPTALRGLVDFLRRYHVDEGTVPPVGGGDAVDDYDVSDRTPFEAALEQATLAIGELGRDAARPILDEITAHPSVPPVVRTAAMQRPAAQGPNGGTEAPAEMTFQAPPTRLSMETLAEAFAPHREALLGCLANAPSRPSQVRIQFRYNAEGEITQPLVLPASFLGCMRPLVEAIRLPTSAAGRELGTYYLQVP